MNQHVQQDPKISKLLQPILIHTKFRNQPEMLSKD